MKRSKENVIVVSINKSLVYNKMENIKLLENQITNIFFGNETKKMYPLNKTGTECKIYYENVNS